MRKATKTVATWFGIAAGIAGIEHGYFEILQGNTKPEGLMIPSMGPPCVPEEVWNACEPAMTIIPNFLITGILAVIIGLFVLIWSIGISPAQTWWYSPDPALGGAAPLRWRPLPTLDWHRWRRGRDENKQARRRETGQRSRARRGKAVALAAGHFSGVDHRAMACWVFFQCLYAKSHVFWFVPDICHASIVCLQRICV